MFDHISGHHGRAKLTPKINHHIYSDQRLIPPKSGILFFVNAQPLGVQLYGFYVHIYICVTTPGSRHGQYSFPHKAVLCCFPVNPSHPQTQLFSDLHLYGLVLSIHELHRNRIVQHLLIYLYFLSLSMFWIYPQGSHNLDLLVTTKVRIWEFLCPGSCEFHFCFLFHMIHKFSSLSMLFYVPTPFAFYTVFPYC